MATKLASLASLKTPTTPVVPQPWQPTSPTLCQPSLPHNGEHRQTPTTTITNIAQKKPFKTSQPIVARAPLRKLPPLPGEATSPASPPKLPASNVPQNPTTKVKKTISKLEFDAPDFDGESMYDLSSTCQLDLTSEEQVMH